MRCQRSPGDIGPEFRDGAVRVLRETGKSTRQVADDLGINPGPWPLGREGEARPGEKLDPERVNKLEREVEELKMGRDVLKRSLVPWAKEATNR